MDYARSFAHSDSLADFIKKPIVILRATTAFILMLIFSCILDKGYNDQGICSYNNTQGACNYTVGIAVIAFFVCLALLAATYFWDNISNTVTRRYIVFGDLAFSAFWTFLFFVDFCFITDMWRKTPDSIKDTLTGFEKSNLQFTIVCSLVTVFLLAAQSYLSYKQLNDIQNDASGLGGYNDSNPEFGGGFGGSGFPPHTESAGPGPTPPGPYQSPYAQ